MPDFNVAGTIGPPSGAIGESMLQGLGHPLREVVDVDVSTYTLQATDDAGDGTVADDVNNTDFTGQPPGSGNPDTFATIGPRDIVNVTHALVLYQYTGPHDVTIGLGGNYTTVAGDYFVQGTADHALLANLDAADQHPQSAVIGLVAGQAAQDQAFIDHISPLVEIDPHEQYLHEDAAVQVFQGLGYGGIDQSADTPIVLGAGWTTIDGWVAGVATAPIQVVQDILNGGLQLGFSGLWNVNILVNVAHNEDNGSRELGLRLFNFTAGVPLSSALTIPVGRNQPGTFISIPLLVEVSTVDQLIQLQLSALIDTFSAVAIANAHFSVSLTSAYEGALP